MKKLLYSVKIFFKTFFPGLAFHGRWLVYSTNTRELDKYGETNGLEVLFFCPENTEIRYQIFCKTKEEAILILLAVPSSNMYPKQIDSKFTWDQYLDETNAHDNAMDGYERSATA